jgi:two-component system NarL family response regulator
MIADDHPMVRDGLSALLDRAPGLTVVALAADGAEAVRMFNLRRPDVILMDLVMPVMDGMTAIGEILSEAPEARIVILTGYDDEERVFRGLRAGAQSYLLKETPVEDLIDVIRKVHSGERPISPRIAAKLAARLCEADLTRRETEVLREVSKGKTNEEIASALNIAPSTVKTHVNHLLAKLQVADRTQAAIAAFKRGLVRL